MSIDVKAEKLLSGMRKQFGEGAKISMAADLQGTRTFRSSGSLALDFALGNGGWPTNRVVEICGAEHTGKTTLALLTMRTFLLAQPDRYGLLLDAEHKSDAEWVASMVGEDLMPRIMIAQPLHIEHATDMYVSAVGGNAKEGIPPGLVCCAILDSIGGAPSMQSVNKSAEIATYGGNAQGVGRFARLAASHSNIFDCLTIGINQVRADMSGLHQTCLSGDTKVLTRRGFRPIQELAGGTHEILTDNSVWVKAPFRQFGEDELWDVTVERYGVRKTIKANASHRWPVRRAAHYRPRPADMEPTHDIGWGSCPDKDCPLHGQCHCPLYCGIETSVPHTNSTQRKWIKGVPLQFTRGHHQKINGLGHGKYSRVKLSDRQMIATENLMVGDYMTTNTPRLSIKGGELLKWAVAWGFVFGDGTKGRRGDKEGYGSLSIYDAAPKDLDILPYFNAFNSRRYDSPPGGRPKTEVYGFPNMFKDLPGLEEPELFLYSWLAGYVAADGDIDKWGNAGLTSVSLKNIEFVQDVCAKLGIPTGPVEVRNKGPKEIQPGRFTPPGTDYHLNFPVGALPKNFFVLGVHRNNHREAQVAKARWRVVEIRPTGFVEPVYCATVPETETFTLEDYILTGNCRPGGHAWKHAIVQAVVLKKGQGKVFHKLNGEDVQVGQEVKAKVIKNGCAPPGRTAAYWFFNVPTDRYAFGIDTLDEIVRLSLLSGVIERKGGWYHHGALPTGRILGKDKLEAAIRDDTALFDTLRSEVMARLAEVADQVAPLSDPDAPIDDTTTTGWGNMLQDGKGDD